MRHFLRGIAAGGLLWLWVIQLEAADFVVGDQNSTVTNFTISPTGLRDGDSVLFSGQIEASHMGVMILPVPNDLTLRFTAESTVKATDRASTAIILGNPFNGTFIHEGTAMASSSGITFSRAFSGSFLNRGNVFAAHKALSFGSETVSGTITNTGLIQGGDDGIFAMDRFEGSIRNTGTIEGTSRYGIYLMGGSDGVILNAGGRIVGGRQAIRLGAGDGTVVLSGLSQVVGGIDGGADHDTLRFENMRGVSEAKRAELKALAESNPSTGSITLFGEVIEWENFESIEADFGSLLSYESLVTAAGLGGFARALDNPLSFGDQSREFLTALSGVEAADLNAVAANLSGQTMISAFDQFGREQDSRLFSLLGGRFSSLRGEVSGRETSAGGGWLSSEVPAGGAWETPGRDSDVFVSGFSGSGDQDPSLNRADARYDATSVVFGLGRQISDHWNLGVFGGYGRNEAQVDQFVSELETRSAYAGVTAQYVNGAFFTNVVAGYGYLESDSDRRDFLGNRMTGDRNGHQGMVYARTGWDFAFGSRERGRVTPYLGMAMSHMALDGFAERGPSVTSLRFQDDSFSSVQSIVGLNVAGYQETGVGWIKPRLDVAWWQALDGAESSPVSLVTPGLLNPFTVSTESADESRAVLQLGADFSFEAMPNWIFNAGYFGSFGEDGYSAHGGMFGVRIDF